jgi:hypothetical protein
MLQVANTLRGKMNLSSLIYRSRAMMTITLDDKVVNEVIAVGHFRNAQEAVINILTDYVLQHKNAPSFFDQLRLTDDIADDQLATLFERNKDAGRNVEL